MAGEDVLITGAGPIGIMAAAVCKFVGARHVVITDINDERLVLAKKLGIQYTVNTTKEKLSDVMKKLSIKNLNFKTEDSFKDYMKSKLYNYNDVAYINYSDEISGVFTYYIEISNRENKSDKKIKMNIMVFLIYSLRSYQYLR